MNGRGNRVVASKKAETRRAAPEETGAAEPRGPETPGGIQIGRDKAGPRTSPGDEKIPDADFVHARPENNIPQSHY